MRVGIDGRLIDHTVGGIARYVAELSAELPKVAADVDLRLLRGAAPPRRWRSALRGALLTPPHHQFEQFALPIELLRHRLDVLHSPDFIPPFRRPCRSVVTVHDLGFLRYPSTLTASSREYYRRVGDAIRSAERTIAVSWATARDIEELLGVDVSTVRVVHNGVAERFRPSPDADADRRVAVRHGLDRPFVLFVGSIEPRKNVPTLLRAISLVREQHDVLLAIVGRRGWLYEEVFSTIAQLSLAGSVRIIESLPDSDLPSIYRAAELFAFPSLYEGFGLPPLEAMACGTPTIVADTSSLPEIVGDAALRHEPLDHVGLARAMVSVLESAATRNQLRQSGIERAARFTWRRSAELTAAVYREAMGQS